MMDFISFKGFLSFVVFRLARGNSRARLKYKLGPKAIVFDCGGHKGEWSADIVELYNPYIYIFEPVEEYYRELVSRFKSNPKIKIYNVGLGKNNTTAKMALLDDESSTYRIADVDNKDLVSIKLINITDFIKENKISRIDLIKINIEGGEYDLLDELLKTGFVKKIDNIQVQFHRFIPDAISRMHSIQNQLKFSHRITYRYPYVWENWKRID